MKNKSVLITGIAGLLGSRLSDWILENKPYYNVIGIDNLFGGYKENVDERCKLYVRDLADDDISDIFEKHDIEYVFHFAAFAAEGLSPFIRKFTYKNNCVATANIINECIKKNIKRLIYTSSAAVYGHDNGEHDRFDENDRPQPIDPYGIAKYACEMDIQVAGKQHGLDWCIIRPHNVYGEKQNIWDKYRNVLGIWMCQALNNQPMTVYGDGEQVRSFTYIGDILECIWKCAEQDNTSKEIINLGSIENITINNAIKMLSKIIGYDNIQYLEKRYESKLSIPTFEKSVKLLNFKHRTNLQEGLIKMWSWAKLQPQRESYKFSDYELNNGLYMYWK